MNDDNLKKAHNFILLISVVNVLLAFVSTCIYYDGSINTIYTGLILFWVISIALMVYLINNNSARKLSLRTSYTSLYLNRKFIDLIGYIVIVISSFYACRSVELLISAKIIGVTFDLRNSLLFGDMAINNPIFSRLMPYVSLFSMYLMVYFAAYGNKRYLFMFGTAFALCEVSVLSRNGIFLILIAIFIYLFASGYKLSKLIVPSIILYLCIVVIGFTQNRLPSDASIFQVIINPFIQKMKYLGYIFALGNDESVQKYIQEFPSMSIFFGWPYNILSDVFNGTSLLIQWSDFVLHGFPIEFDGQMVLANYVHSTPLIIFVNSGIIVYVFSIVLTIFFSVFATRYFGQAMGTVVIFFALFRATTTPLYIGPEFFICMPLIFILEHHYKIKRRSKLAICTKEIK
jgi:hypothetical protein